MRTSLFCSLVLTGSLCAQTAHFWVDAKNGNDGNAGTKAKPFRTLTKGVTARNFDAVVHVMSGVYGPQTTGDFWDATTKAPKKLRLATYTNFKIVGEDRTTCVIDFNNIGSVWNGLIEITGQATDGVEIANLTFKNCAITPAWGCGPINTTNRCRNVDIHSCYFENAGSAFICWGGFDVAFHDNVITTTTTNRQFVAIRVRTQYGNAGNGDRTYVYNNTIHNGHHGISHDAKATKQWICNNVVLNCDRGFPGSAPPANVILENNIAAKCTINFNYTPKPSNRTVDPQLVDPAKGDFRQKAGSPCLDGGWPFGLLHMANDWFGNSRMSDGNDDRVSRPDIGAHEVHHVSLSVSDWGQGKTAKFQLNRVGPFVYPSLFFFGWGRATVVLQPYGLIPLDPSKIVLFLSTVAPGTVNLPIPNVPGLTGFPVYAHAIGFRPVSSGLSFKPTGRLDLYL